MYTQMLQNLERTRAAVRSSISKALPYLTKSTGWP